jgi:hypothetical protein
MKFKVGDYVRIKEGAKVGRIPEGKCYKIIKAKGGYYNMEIDRPDSLWTEGVLELATPKDILEPGMIFECRNGYRYMFISENYAINEAFYINDVFNENALGKWDIVKIYEKTESGSLKYSLENTENVIWEEKAPVKEMTIKEFSEKLGYEIKVIKE